MVIIFICKLLLHLIVMSSPAASNNFPSITSSLQSALDVLVNNGFSAFDLPIDHTDPMWDRLEKEFKLTLGQLSALHNYIKSRHAATALSIRGTGTTFVLSATDSTGGVASHSPPPDNTRTRRREGLDSLLKSAKNTGPPHAQHLLKASIDNAKSELLQLIFMLT